MKHARIAAAIALLALAVSCGRNPRYCDEDTACGDPTYVCDLAGVCPESEGLRNSCIPPSAVCWDAGTTNGSDAGGDGDAADVDAPPSASRPSCVGLDPTCGPTSTDDCCADDAVPGGSYYRSYDAASDLYNDDSYPASVSGFVLDRYEISVGRFRKFVEAGMGTQSSPPPSSSGFHSLIPGSGWNASWNSILMPDTSNLVAAVQCGSGQTWTDSPGANENQPVTCISWYEAFAFCIWDGGYLPTEAEWNYAAAGGDEQRAYPWSSPPSDRTIDCSYANYGGSNWPTTACVDPGTGGANAVGSESQKGDGRWTHADLSGNAWEWVLDAYGTYSFTCDDCANLGAAPSRVFRGGGFSSGAVYLRTGRRDAAEPFWRHVTLGARCARPAP